MFYLSKASWSASFDFFLHETGLGDICMHKRQYGELDLNQWSKLVIFRWFKSITPVEYYIKSTHTFVYPVPLK